MFSRMMIHPGFPMKCHKKQTEHVKGRKEGCQCANRPIENFPRTSDSNKISSLLKNPANGGIPAIATVPTKKVLYVVGI